MTTLALNVEREGITEPRTFQYESGEVTSSGFLTEISVQYP